MVARVAEAVVVEHDPKVRDVVKDVLKGHGYTVHAVASRAEGFDLLEELSPVLLFLDDPARDRARRLVRLDASGTPDVTLADVRPERVREWLEEVLAS